MNLIFKAFHFQLSHIFQLVNFHIFNIKQELKNMYIILFYKTKRDNKNEKLSRIKQSTKYLYL